MIFIYLIIGISSSSPILGTNVTCNENQWLCGSECIHRRSFCVETGSCHVDFPRPCGDGSRCYHRLDSCWASACFNVDCHYDSENGQNVDDLGLNKIQVWGPKSKQTLSEKFYFLPICRYSWVNSPIFYDNIYYSFHVPRKCFVYHYWNFSPKKTLRNSTIVVKM